MTFPSLICKLGVSCKHCVEGTDSDSDSMDEGVNLCPNSDCDHCYLTESEYESESESVPSTQCLHSTPNLQIFLGKAISSLLYCFLFTNEISMKFHFI